MTLNNIYLLLFSADKGDRKEFVHVPCPSKLEKNIKQGNNSIYDKRHTTLEFYT